MKKNFVSEIGKYFKPGEKIVLGFSSGPDSVFLADCVSAVSERKKLKVCIAHLNHMLRGAESDRDEKFAETFAGARGMSFYSERKDVAALRKKLSIGMEEAARIARYDFFMRSCGRFNSSTLVLGHNLDDVVETGLMRIIKGTSVDGLGSIRKESVFNGIKIVRPLVNTEKSEILKYLKERKIRFRVDKSNRDKNIIRNKIRLELIPLLKKEYNPAVSEALSRLMSGAASASDVLSKEAGRELALCLKEETGGCLRLDCGKLVNTPDAVVSRMIKTVILSAGADPKKVTFINLSRIVRMLRREGENKSFSFGSLVISKDGNFLYVEPRGEKSRALKKSFSLGSGVTAERVGLKTEILKAGGGTFRKIREDFKKQKAFDFSKGALSGVQYFDASKSGKRILLRSAAEGDRYRPSGLNGRKKIQDILVDSKVLCRRRNKIPVFCDMRGRIIFLAGYRISEDFKVTPKSRLIGRIRFRFEL
ncbi:tRNA lysidine(34) synthetase TilS [bacterium]|jgi:tRNA(Ile)-lysidine synthase|nr:tRNA lysidine(34) synthetase TilS [bacterium]